MTTMYDSTDWTAIPASAAAVGGYINGRYKWPDNAWDFFTGTGTALVPIWVYWPARTDPEGDAAEALSIVRRFLPPGSTIVLDVEASDALRHSTDHAFVTLSYLSLASLQLQLAGGAMSTDYAPRFVQAIRAGGYSPAIYTSRSTWDTLKPAQPDDFWIGDYTTRPHLLDGAAAIQWTAPESGSSGDWDLSELRDGWPRRGAVVPVDPWPANLAVPVLVDV